MVVTDSGWGVERVFYTAYGEPEVFPFGDADGDYLVDGTDQTLITAIKNGSQPYNILADLNLDGAVTQADLNAFSAYSGALGGRNVLTASNGSATTGNDIGYAGYTWNDERSQWHVRHREYDPKLGRWLQRDPAEYAADWNAYTYISAHMLASTDPTGASPTGHKGVSAFGICAVSGCYDLCTGEASFEGWCWFGVGYDSKWFGWIGYSKWFEGTFVHANWGALLSCGKCDGSSSGSDGTRLSKSCAAGGSCGISSPSATQRPLSSAAPSGGCAGTGSGPAYFAPEFHIPKIPAMPIECGIIGEEDIFVGCRSFEVICLADLTDLIPYLAPVKRAMKAVGVDCGLKVAVSVHIGKCRDSNGDCVVSSAKVCLSAAIECGVGAARPPRPGRGGPRS